MFRLAKSIASDETADADADAEADKGAEAETEADEIAKAEADAESSESQAQEWADYKLVPISLEELLDQWLTGLHADLLLVGPNWNAELAGDELEPLDLLEDFEEAMED